MANDLHVVELEIKEADPHQCYSVGMSDWYIVTAKLSDGRTVKTEAGITAESLADWQMCRIVLAEVVMREVRSEKSNA